MPLLVVAVAADEVELLTLGELEALSGREVVLFEDPAHPLAKRLTDAGVAVLALSEKEPDPTAERIALVADPRSARVLELARSGAEVSSGPAVRVDPLTAAHAAPVLRRGSAALAGAVAIMARLRSEDGCPWDREQTHASLQVHLLEEAHEVLDAIDRGAFGEDLAEELGDVLLQVVFHSRLAEQDGRFDVAGVADTLVAKLIRRHPHVFSDAMVSSASEVVSRWEAIKATEKRRGDGAADVLADIPPSLPALLTAYKVAKRAMASGSADETEARARIEAALHGAVDRAILGDALFGLVMLARGAGVEPEGALRSALLRVAASP